MKRYLNAQYPDPRNSANTVAGTDLWLKVIVKRGSKPAPPTVVWYAQRTNTGVGDLVRRGDGLYIDDPVIAPQAAAANSSEQWARITLPPVPGVTWTFKVVRSKAGKPDKTIAVDGNIETWSRLFLDIEAADQGLYTLFTRALPKVVQAFAAANYELVTNLVTIDGEVSQSVNKSVVGGRNQGRVFKLILGHRETKTKEFPFNIRVANNATDCRTAALEGNVIRIRFGPTVTFDANEFLKEVIIKGVNPPAAEIAKFSWYGGVVDDKNGERDRAMAAIGLIANRVGDREMTLNLAAAPLANRWTAQGGGWTTARATTAVQAKNAGPVDVMLKLIVGIDGVLQGEQKDLSTVACYVDDSADEMAVVIAHELGHLFNLVAETRTKKFDVEQWNFNSRQAARVAAAADVRNPRYYNSTFGGAGTHCSNAAVEGGSCITNSRRTYEHDGSANMLCVMYHGLNAQRGHMFCTACINELRGR